MHVGALNFCRCTRSLGNSEKIILDITETLAPQTDGEAFGNFTTKMEPCETERIKRTLLRESLPISYSLQELEKICAK